MEKNKKRRIIHNEKLLNFLETLEERKIYYKLNKVRESIMVEIAVPGQRWEVEFFPNGEVQIEKFISNGKFFGVSEIEALFDGFTE